MSKRGLPAWEPQHRASIRHRVAREAARILYHRECKEYLHAKREAARRQGTPHLPTNREVHEQLLCVARNLEGPEHARRLRAMREAALALMACLAEFAPRLVGSVWTGHIRSGSDIDLHLYSLDLDGICRTLQQEGYAPRVETVTSRKDHEIKDFVHVHLDDVRSYPVDITLHEPTRLRMQLRCGITGGRMPRATAAQVQESLQFPCVLKELPPMYSPLDLERIAKVVPELLAAERNGAVSRAVQGFVGQRFAVLGELNRPLLAHFASAHASSLLFLAAACHDLGEPLVWARVAQGLGDSLRCPLLKFRGWHREASKISLEDGPPSHISRLFRAVGPYLPELALFSLAVANATRPETERDEEQVSFAYFLLEEYFDGGFLANPILPVCREDLEEEFGLADPARQQQVLEWLLDGFVDGEFEGKEEGLNLASDYLSRPHLEGSTAGD